MLASSHTTICDGNLYCQFFTDKGLESETGFLSEVRHYVCRIVGELPGSPLSPLLFNWGPGRPHIPLVRQEVVVVVVEDVVEVVLEIAEKVAWERYTTIHTTGVSITRLYLYQLLSGIERFNSCWKTNRYSSWSSGITITFISEADWVVLLSLVDYFAH